MPQEPPARIRSSTRAVAWAAMFFAVLSLVVSMFLLFTAWEDGKLLTNARLLWQDVKPTLDRLADRPAAEEIRWDRIRERFERLETMVQEGDQQARYYLDTIRGDLDVMREYTTERSSQWLGEASQRLGHIREQLADDAPGAIRDLRRLAAESMRQEPEETERPDNESEQP